MIELRVFDISTGKIVNVATKDIRGSIEDVLTGGIRDAVRELVN